MVSQQFWRPLSPELQTAMTEAWAAVVDTERKEAAAAQERARGILAEHGITITVPPKEALEAARRKLVAAQDGIVAEMKIDRALVATAMSELRAAGVRV
jgi:C4-dicarboxylate-binding protein DctP